jgi:hypothetical protein
MPGKETLRGTVIAFVNALISFAYKTGQSSGATNSALRPGVWLALHVIKKSTFVPLGVSGKWSAPMSWKGSKRHIYFCRLAMYDY